VASAAPEPPPAKPTAAQLAAFGARPGVQRTVKLAGLDMRPESLREWVYVIRGLDDDGLLLAAEYARSQGLYDRAINTAERTVARHDFSLRYLMPYRDHFSRCARTGGRPGDPAWTWRCECASRSTLSRRLGNGSDATDAADRAVGSGNWRDDYQPTQIGDIALNTQLARSFRTGSTDGTLARTRPPLTTPAWAGPARGASARRRAQSVETIPFNETRDYVKRCWRTPVLRASARSAVCVARTARHNSATGASIAGGNAVAVQANQESPMPIPSCNRR
jgi:soluble lytic murein transglycosylase